MVKPNDDMIKVDVMNIRVLDDEDDETMVYINLRIPMSVKLRLDELYIKRIKENPKVRFTRSKTYLEVFDAGLKALEG